MKKFKFKKLVKKFKKFLKKNKKVLKFVVKVVAFVKFVLEVIELFNSWEGDLKQPLPILLNNNYIYSR